MSTLFTIASGNLTDNIFARTITNADTTSQTDVLGIGNTPIDISTFTADGSNIWGVSFNVKSRSQNASGKLSCKLYDSYNTELGSFVVPISNFPAGDNTGGINGDASEIWQTIKFDNSIATSNGSSYYLRLSASSDGELFLYGLPQLDETIIDHASNLDIVATGNTTQGSFNPYNVKSWTWFTNDSGYISYPSSESFNLSTANFTIDFWVFLKEERQHRILSFVDFNVDISSTNVLQISGVSTELTLEQDKWQHVAIVRNGSTLNGYVNGVKGTTINIVANKNFAKNTLFIGKDRTASTPYMHGHLYNLRITKNSALYSANFSLPTSNTSRENNGGATPSVTPDSENVSLLILNGENRLEDKSEKLSIVGTPSVITQSPYAQDYVQLNMGGGYLTTGVNLDKSHIKVTLPATISGGFTIEFFARLMLLQQVMLVQNNLFEFFMYDSTLKMYLFAQKNMQATAQSHSIYDYDFHHFAISRDSSNNIRLFIDGVLMKTIVVSGALDRVIYFGVDPNSTTSQSGIQGVLSNLRITAETLYTTNFTVPTTPLNALSNTKTLIAARYGNVLYKDRSVNPSKNEIVTSSKVSLATNIKKYGNGSIYFNSANLGILTVRRFDTTNLQSLVEPIDNQFAQIYFNDPYWTLEFDIYFTRAATNEQIAEQGDVTNSSGAPFSIFKSSTNEVNVQFNKGSTKLIFLSASQFTANTWYHFALVKNNDTFNTYCNGQLVQSKPSVVINDLYTYYAEINNSSLHFGARASLVDLNPIYPFHGYMDNITLYMDAIYTSNFTPSNNKDIKKAAIYINADDVGLTRTIVDETGISTISNSDDIVYGLGGPAWNVNNIHTTSFDSDVNIIEYSESTKYQINSNQDFTLECWFNTKTLTGNNIASVGSENGFNLFIENNNVKFGTSGVTTLIPLVSYTALSADRWYHTAITRESGSLKMYVNGTLVGTTSDSTEFASGSLRIGGGPNGWHDGFVTDLRLTKNQVLYTTQFTTPTAYLTETSNGGATPSTTPVLSNVAFLYCNETATPASEKLLPTIAGNSSIIAAVSSVSTPFTNEQEYLKDTHSGSIFFDGTGDLATVSERNNEFTFGTSDFTVEFWYYPLVASGNILKTFSGSTDLADGVSFYFSNTTTPAVKLGNNNTTEILLQATANTLKQWNHFALTKKNDIYRFFINGKLVDSAYYTGLNLQNDSDSLIMGETCNGYISDVRVVKGQALYIDTFDTPNSSLSINNTVSLGFGAKTLTTPPNLLVKGTAAGIYDASANNNVLLEGSAFGLSLAETINSNSNYTDNALIFNGPADKNYLVIPPSPNFDFSGDFWIDFWMNTEKWKTDTIGRRILTLGSVSSVSALQVCVNATGSDRKLQLFSNVNILSSNFDYADGTWHHVGIGRSGSTLSLYRDGVLDASVTNTVDYKSGVLNNSYVGIYGDSSLNKGRYQGKLVGLRVINGECVHTSNYSLPTGAPSLISDGGTGVNSLGNVVYYQKLNNIIAPINSHMIVGETQKLSSAITNPGTGDVTLNNVVSSSRIPAQVTPGTSSSRFTPSSSSYITIPTTGFEMKGDWTIETYVYPVTGTIHNSAVGAYERTIWSLQDLSLGFLNNTYQLRCTLLPNAANLSASGTLSAWAHVAVCRKGNDISLYVNGTRTSATTASIASNMAALSTRSMYMGILDFDGLGGYVGLFSGDVYNTRIIDGRALYDGNFNTTTVVVPSTLSATADTVFLYNNAKDTLYYKPGPIEKTVITGYLNGNDNTQLTINNSLSDTVLNNISIQNGGILTAPANTNSTINVTNRGLKIGGGGKFTLSASSGYNKTVNLVESKIHVMHGGRFEVAGLPKTGYITLTGSHAVGSTVFTSTETPVNWLSGDSLIMLPTSASASQFDELTARSVVNNRLSTTSASLYVHQNYDGIPTVVNTGRNISIKGLNSSRRGWLQFDKTSNSYICDTKFENLGRDGATTESLIFNVKQDGYALLSGCFVDGTGGTSVNGNNLFDKCYNLNLLNNTFYKQTGDGLCFNKSLYNSNVSNNLLLRSSLNGLRLENISLNSDVVMANNVAMSNTSRGTYLDNVDGYVSGIKNWLNTTQGLYLATPSKGENVDLTNADAIVTDEATNNTVLFDSPFGSTYPEETCSTYTKSITWGKNVNYFFDEDFTIEGFYRFNAASTQESRLFVTNPGVEGIGSIKLTYIVNTRSLKFYTNESTSTAKISITVPYAPLSMWHHIAVCRENGVVSLYFNGERLGTYSSNFEFDGTVAGIAIGSSTLDASSKSVYGFRVLTSAVYASQNNITVPTAPFTVNSDTVLLYKRTVKTGTTSISNIQNYYNTAGGLYIDGSVANLENTTISNISSVNNTTFGISISSTNTDYKEAVPVTAKDLYIVGNKTIGFIVNNMAAVLSGVYIANSTTNNAQLRFGNGVTKVNGLTSLMSSNNPNVIIHSSKSYNPVNFNNVTLNKSSTLTTAYTGIPLYIRDTEFSNFNFDNSTITNIATGYSVALSGSTLGSYQFTNTTITSAGVQNLSCLPVQNIKTAGVVFMNKNGVVGSHESYTRLGKRSTDTTLSAGNVAEKLTPYSASDKFKSGSKYVAIDNNNDVSIKVKVAVSNDYNGNSPRLMIKKNSSIGFTSDQVAYTFPKTTSYTEASITTPIVTGNGIIEFYVDCDGTVGSIFIDDWKLN